jgi:hypothetical protein
MAPRRRFLKGWVSSILGILVIVMTVLVLALVNKFHLIVELVLLAGGFSIGGWLLGMDDTLIEHFLNIHKLDKDGLDESE